MPTDQERLKQYISENSNINPAIINTLVKSAIDSDVAEITCNVTPTRTTQTIEPASGNVYNKVIVAAVTPIILNFQIATSGTATETIASVPMLAGETTVQPTTTETLEYFSDAEKTTAYTFGGVINETTTVYFDLAPVTPEE